MAVTKNGNYCYRDELVQKIKDAGKDLVERAEEMVSEKNQLNTDFIITIHFPQGACETPIISYTNETLVKSYLQRKFNMFPDIKTERCITCGEEIPEGRQICPRCEEGEEI